MKLKLYGLLLIIIALASGCATYDPKQVLKKQIEEDRFIPAGVISGNDYLDSYSHPLPVSQSNELNFSLYFHKNKYYVNEKSTYLLLGFNSIAPKAKQDHVTVLQSLKSKTTLGLGEKVNQALVNSFKQIQTIDLADSKIDLETFFTNLAKERKINQGKHFVIVFDHKLNFGPEKKIIDIVELLSVWDISVSILAAHEKPDFGFYSRVLAKSKGTLNLYSSNMKFDDWAKQEVKSISAIYYKQVKINLTMEGMNLAQTYSYNKAANISVGNVEKGKAKILLLPVQLNQSQLLDKKASIDVNVEYFDPVSNRFKSVGQSKILEFSNDRNIVFENSNYIVERAITIQNTVESIDKVARLINSGRYFAAVKHLDLQIKDIENILALKPDAELNEDIVLLSNYQNMIFEREDESFSGFKNFLDLKSDRSRFN